MRGQGTENKAIRRLGSLDDSQRRARSDSALACFPWATRSIGVLLLRVEGPRRREAASMRRDGNAMRYGSEDEREGGRGGENSCCPCSY